MYNLDSNETVSTKLRQMSLRSHHITGDAKKSDNGGKALLIRATRSLGCIANGLVQEDITYLVPEKMSPIGT